MTPLRILHTESSTGMGGQEFRILAEACGMVRRGHMVILAVPPESRLKEYGERKGLRIAPVAVRRRRWIPLIVDFLSLIREHKIQILNTHGSVDSWTG